MKGGIMEQVREESLNCPQKEWFRGVDFSSSERGNDNLSITILVERAELADTFAAIAFAVNRHESLRTTVSLEDQERGLGRQHCYAPAWDGEAIKAVTRPLCTLDSVRSYAFEVASEFPFKLVAGVEDTKEGLMRVVMVLDHSAVDARGTQIIHDDIIVRGTALREDGTRADVQAVTEAQPLQPIDLTAMERMQAALLITRREHWWQASSDIARSLRRHERHLATLASGLRGEDLPTHELEYRSRILPVTALAYAQISRVSVPAVYLSFVLLAQMAANDVTCYSPQVICQNRSLPRAHLSAAKFYMPCLVHFSLDPKEQIIDVLRRAQAVLMGARNNCHVDIPEVAQVVENTLTDAYLDNFFNFVGSYDRSHSVLREEDSREESYSITESRLKRWRGRRLMIDVSHTSGEAIVRLKYRSNVLNSDSARHIMSSLQHISERLLYEDLSSCQVGSLRSSTV
jgi:hypothetical protein